MTFSPLGFFNFSCTIKILYQSYKWFNWTRRRF